MTCSLLNILWQFIRKLFASLSQSCLPYCYWLIGLQPVYFKTVNSCLVSASLWEKNLTLIQYIIYFSVDYNKTIKSDKDEQTSISVQMFISEWPFELFLRCKALKHTHTKPNILYYWGYNTAWLGMQMNFVHWTLKIWELTGLKLNIMSLLIKSKFQNAKVEFLCIFN